MRYYCTYFDRGFLPRALALYDSLRRWSGPFHLWALCLDEESRATLSRLRLPGVEPLSLAELERADPALLRVKAERSRLEYYFTLSPVLPLHLLRSHPEMERLTYLDADLYFYADPEPLFAESHAASIALIPLRYAPAVRDRQRYGRYNVGWLSFRPDRNGFACLEWWRERCLEWCYARVEGDRYADQKYLDRWPERFEGVHVVRHTGANLGPWSLETFPLSVREGRVYVDEDPLLFYHFTSFLQVAPWLYNTNLASWHVRPNTLVRRRIIGPYIAALRQVAARYGGLAPSAPAADRAPGHEQGRLVRLLRKARTLSRIGCRLLQQDHLLVVRGQVL